MKAYRRNYGRTISIFAEVPDAARLLGELEQLTSSIDDASDLRVIRLRNALRKRLRLEGGDGGTL